MIGMLKMGFLGKWEKGKDPISSRWTRQLEKREAIFPPPENYVQAFPVFFSFFLLIPRALKNMKSVDHESRQQI